MAIKDIYVCSKGENVVKMHLQQNISGVKKVLVNNIYVPISYYFINETNNQFICHYDGANELITLTPNRNYNGTELATELQTKLNDISGSNWTVTFNVNTLKFTFADSNNVDKHFVFTNHQLAKIYLGFKSDVTSVFDDNTTLTSEIVVQLSHDILYLRSNGLVTNNIDINGNFSNILTDIPVFSEFDSVNFFRVEASDLKNLVFDNFFYLEFYITDKFGNVINFNGSSFSFKLVLYFSQ